MLQIYDPIMEQCLVKERGANGRRTQLGRQMGVAASFVVSGIVHELILRWACTGMSLAPLHTLLPAQWCGSL